MSSAWPILAVVSPALTGWLLIGAVMGSAPRGFWAGATRMIAGVGVGFAIASGIYFLWRTAGAETGFVYRVFDSLLVPFLAALAFVACRRHCAPSSRNSTRASPWALALAGLALLIAVVAISASISLAQAESSGNWDANAIWNLKARFFFRGGGGLWTRMFAKEIWFSHPDYPLLLPAAVARLWTYVGRETHVAPIMLGIGFTALTISLLFTALAALRGLVAASIGVLLLAANETFLWYAGAQVADVPLSSFVLSAVVFLMMAWESGDDGGGGENPRLRSIALAGACAGLGAFVKNEGLAICVIFAIACTITAIACRRWKSLGALIAGMAITLTIVVTQKFLFTGETFLTADQPSSGAIFDKLLDPDRHRTILTFLSRWYFGLREWYSPVEGWRLNQWPIPMLNEPAFLLLLALPLIFGVRIAPNRRPPALAIALLLVFVFVTYYAVLLIMPYDLSVLVQSLPRYFLHIVPSAIFFVCYVTRWERDAGRVAPVATEPITTN